MSKADVSPNCSDYNYERQTDNTCRIVGSPPNPFELCAADSSRETYNEVTGYRKIPLDTCVGGKESALLGELRDCPGHEGAADEENKRKGRATGPSKVGIFFAVVISLAVAAGVGWFVWTRFVRGRFGRIQLGDSMGGAGAERMGSALGSMFRADAPWIKWPIIGVSAVVAGVMAVPMLVTGAWRRIRGGGDSYYRAGGYRPATGRPYTSRSSFARGRGDYATVGAADESDLLGEDSEDEV